MDISGVCGRLLCCLAYESDFYAEAKKKLPKRGKVIDTPHGQGTVTQVDIVKESVQVELENQTTVEVSHQELLTMTKVAPPTPRRRKRRRQHKR
jgi:cell fate regulator YaaT (PSP1 superfamily)